MIMKISGPALFSFICVLGGFLTACSDGTDGQNGSNGSNGSNGLTGLLAITSESPGSNCVNGGTRVDSGVDINANGVLQTAEIVNTQYICNARATDSLVESRSEAAGSNCSSGGKRFIAGLDANRNGVLDASEINSTGYICNGAAGSAGVNSLTAVASEPVGANCAGGGVKIAAGPDSNGNASLDVAEVVSTQYVCNGISATNSLIRTDNESAGANCAYGGTHISAGQDTNGNAALDPIEVAANAYACNGAPGPGVTWENVTGTTVQALSNRGYMANNDSARVAVTLPSTPTLGDIIQVSGLGAGGWSIEQNAGQAIVTRNLPTEAGSVWTAHEPSLNWRAIASSADGTRLVAAEQNGPLYVSTDSGVSWTARDTGRNWISLASSADGMRLAAAVLGGQIYTSSDGGVNWVARESNRNWYSVASSADGLRLVAGVGPLLGGSGQLYTSTDGGVTWSARESNRGWYAVASSADGVRLAAVVFNGRIYTSSDAGVTWTPSESSRIWVGVASSADGMRLVATANGAQIYTSSDAGLTWTARDSNRSWTRVASSADGVRLAAACDGGAACGGIYTSSDGGLSWIGRTPTTSAYDVAMSADGMRLAMITHGEPVYTSQPVTRNSTSAGASGRIVGDQFDSITLQYAGGNRFVVLNSAGAFEVQ
jgi:hypothetical protein